MFTYQVSYRKSVNTNSVPFFLWKGMLIGLGGLVSPLVQVFGVGIPNPYRLRPFIGARVPVNSSFSPLINIHNPHSEPLQVTPSEHPVSVLYSVGSMEVQYPTDFNIGGMEFTEGAFVSTPLQVVEMYSSGGDLHLELPTGQQGGTRKLWVSFSSPAPLMRPPTL